MRVNQSKEKIFYDNNEGDDMYKEYLLDKSNRNLEFIPFERIHADQIGITQYYKPSKEIQKLAENVGGVRNDLGRLQSLSEGGDITLTPQLGNKKESSEDLVRDLETYFEIKIPHTIRKAVLEVASVNIKEDRGATVFDIENRLKVKRDYAEKLLEKAKKAELIVACNRRAEKMYQYVLSNYQDRIDVKSIGKRGNHKQRVLPNDITLLLAQELSRQVYVYHNLGFETNLLYLEDYDAVKWRIPSVNNKQKVQTFRLDVQRNCTMTISPTGTINISIGCTHRPYHLHTAAGFRELFVSCGQILNIIQLSAGNRTNVVSDTGEWNIIRFDYNKDISTSKLNEKYPAIQWNSKGVLKLKYLDSIFQFYSKNMPFEGNIFRSEGQYVTEKKSSLFEIAQGMLSKSDGHPFTTIEEMLTAANPEA